jgi:hypothetical protein
MLKVKKSCDRHVTDRADALWPNPDAVTCITRPTDGHACTVRPSRLICNADWPALTITCDENSRRISNNTYHSSTEHKPLRADRSGAPTGQLGQCRTIVPHDKLKLLALATLNTDATGANRQAGLRRMLLTYLFIAVAAYMVRTCNDNN